MRQVWRASPVLLAVLVAVGHDVLVGWLDVRCVEAAVRAQGTEDPSVLDLTGCEVDTRNKLGARSTRVWVLDGFTAELLQQELRDEARAPLHEIVLDEVARCFATFLVVALVVVFAVRAVLLRRRTPYLKSDFSIARRKSIACSGFFSTSSSALIMPFVYFSRSTAPA
jgi:hypothetical protein